MSDKEEKQFVPTLSSTRLLAQLSDQDEEPAGSYEDEGEDLYEDTPEVIIEYPVGSDEEIEEEYSDDMDDGSRKDMSISS